jgi:hypothetical protein
MLGVGWSGVVWGRWLLLILAAAAAAAAADPGSSGPG